MFHWCLARLGFLVDLRTVAGQWSASSTLGPWLPQILEGIVPALLVSSILYRGCSHSAYV